MGRSAVFLIGWVPLTQKHVCTHVHRNSQQDLLRLDLVLDLINQVYEIVGSEETTTNDR